MVNIKGLQKKDEGYTDEDIVAELKNGNNYTHLKGYTKGDPFNQNDTYEYFFVAIDKDANNSNWITHYQLFMDNSTVIELARTDLGPGAINSFDFLDQ